jgi:hypothetical protein
MIGYRTDFGRGKLAVWNTDSGENAKNVSRLRKCVVVK